MGSFRPLREIPCAEHQYYKQMEYRHYVCTRTDYINGQYTGYML